MSTAGQDILEGLHRALADSYARMLADPESCSPALLASAARFLKDNNIVLIPENVSALEEVARKYEQLDIIEDEDSKHIEFPRKQA